MDIYTQLKNACMDCSNRIIPHVNAKSWWKKRNMLGVYYEVIKLTSFLDEDDNMTKRIHHILQDITSIPLCSSPDCDCIVNWHAPTKAYLQYCSKSCGSKSTTVKRKATCLEKYGVEDHNKSTDVRDKFKQTCLEKYGVEHPMKFEKVKEKVKETNLARHGVEHCMTLDEYKTKAKYSRVCKYGFYKAGTYVTPDQYQQLHDYDMLLSLIEANNTVADIARIIGVSESFVRQYLVVHNLTVKYRPYGKTSSFEISVIEFLDTLGVEYQTRCWDVISKKELDIYIPDHNVAIECNGTYWHSERNGKDKKYHLNKTMLCKEKGIHLIHVWEHDWNQRQELIKSRIKSKLGFNTRIYGRKTTFNTVSSAEASSFLNENHIQGTCPSSVKIGLYADTGGIFPELVALMTFGKSRYNKEIEWELIRYCSKQGINVVGGASKMFKHFIRTHTPTSVISYSDKMWNTGGLYEAIGLTYTHSTGPAYYYTQDYTSFSNRVAYQKHKLQDKLDVFDPNLTEWENMQANGFDRIWDCGNDVWLYTHNA